MPMILDSVRPLTPALSSSHTDGIVSSTSIVASGAAFEEAVRHAHVNPRLAVGVHLTLVEENSISMPSEVPTLAPYGVLPSSYGRLMKGVMTGRIRKCDIEREFRAQIERCLAAGLKISHLDSHQHTHTLPTLFPIVLRLANDYAIPGIRIPRGWPSYRDLTADRFLPKCVLCLLAHSDALLFRRGNHVTAGHFAGLFETGNLGEDQLLRILANLRSGTTELVCHPGCYEKTGRYANWSDRRGKRSWPHLPANQLRTLFGLSALRLSVIGASERIFQRCIQRNKIIKPHK